MKRTFDFVIAACGLLLLAVPLALMALAVWLEDRASPFYRGPRIGKDGQPFAMLKFRSMVPDAWKSGVNSTAASDPRITHTGAFLRRFKLDELPQLWNVLRGEMSLVGPRPQVPCEVDLYTRAERGLLAVRPGLTDPASIVFADEAEILSGSADADLRYHQIIRPWKSRLGLLYIDRRPRGIRGLALDVKVLILTLAGAVSRPRALRGVAQVLDSWRADPLLIGVARRNQPLVPYPPPGSNEVVSRYPPRREKATHA